MQPTTLRSFVLLALFGLGCTSHDAIGVEDLGHEGPTRLRATIASVQMIEDCADSLGESAKQTAAQAAASLPAPCTQSTMQLSLAHDASDGQRVAVVETRLLRGSDVLDGIAVRKPSRWNGDGTYEAWDERVPAGVEIVVSYHLGVPDWSKVHRQLPEGVPIDSVRYALEVDLVMGETVVTVRSPEFSRQPAHVVET